MRVLQAMVVQTCMGGSMTRLFTALIILALVILAFSPSGHAYAQDRPDCRGNLPGDAILRGQLVAQSPGLDVSRFVILQREGIEGGCSTFASGGPGTFEFSRLPPGRYVFTIGGTSGLKE